MHQLRQHQLRNERPCLRRRFQVRPINGEPITGLRLHYIGPDLDAKRVAFRALSHHGVGEEPVGDGGVERGRVVGGGPDHFAVVHRERR